jgi:hypothetical protein
MTRTAIVCIEKFFLLSCLIASPANARHDRARESRRAATPKAPGGSRVAAPPTSDDPAKGPLQVHPTNARYFSDGSGKAVFLTGSHTWANLQDITYANGRGLATFDFPAYLAFLKEHHHNFFRLWAWESPFNPGALQSTTTYAPLPYQRPGPGTAADGKPKFDVSAFDQAYFDRLRARVAAAHDEGIYVAVMLFQGFSIAGKGNLGGDPWKGHPFHPDNNVNGVDGGGARAHTLSNPDVTALEEAYVGKVIDTVNDLDNVLYEIANEDSGGHDNTEWQYHFIRFIKRYESSKPKQHPVGMTVQFPGGDDALLLESPADWISPKSRFFQGDGRKVVLNDTDHSYFWTGLRQDGTKAQCAWVWKNFMLGNQCLFMDPYLDAWHDAGRNDPSDGQPDAYWEPLRAAMGQTRDLAMRIDLAATAPHGELASTTFCLANPGREYLVYLPDGGETMLDLSGVAGTFRVEWLQPNDGARMKGEPVEGSAIRTLSAPFTGDALLHLEAM